MLTRPDSPLIWITCRFQFRSPLPVYRWVIYSAWWISGSFNVEIEWKAKENHWIFYIIFAYVKSTWPLVLLCQTLVVLLTYLNCFFFTNANVCGWLIYWLSIYLVTLVKDSEISMDAHTHSIIGWSCWIRNRISSFIPFLSSCRMVGINNNGADR